MNKKVSGEKVIKDIRRRTPTKYSSDSTSPENGDSCSHSRAITFLTKSKYLFMVFRFKPVNCAIFVASISRAKYFKICLNLAVEIRARFKIRFFHVMTAF